MATIRKHPVPTDSYDSKRPLNDLLVAQLEHFKHIAKRIPPEAQSAVPAEPANDDCEGVDRFIAAVTRVHIGRKKEKPRLVARPVRRKQPATLDIAAVAEEKPKSNKPVKAKSQGKPKSKTKRGGAGRAKS
jgi:hypothetical protein